MPERSFSTAFTCRGDRAASSYRGELSGAERVLTGVLCEIGYRNAGCVYRLACRLCRIAAYVWIVTVYVVKVYFFQLAWPGATE